MATYFDNRRGRRPRRPLRYGLLFEENVFCLCDKSMRFKNRGKYISHKAKCMFRSRRGRNQGKADKNPDKIRL